MSRRPLTTAEQTITDVLAENTRLHAALARQAKSVGASDTDETARLRVELDRHIAFQDAFDDWRSRAAKSDEAALWSTVLTARAALDAYRPGAGEPT